MAHQHNYTIWCHSAFTLVHDGKYSTEGKWKIQTIHKLRKHNPEKANNTKHGKTKLPRFSRLLQDSEM